MKPTYAIIGVAALAAILIVFGSIYKLDEREQAIILQFGEQKGEPIKSAGLHLKLPFIQDVRRFEKRILEWDGAANQITTEDKRYIWVNVFARWHITNPPQFYKSVGNETGAQSRLDDIIDGVTRDIITKSKLIEVVRSSNRPMQAIGENDEDYVKITGNYKVEKGRDEITRQILQKANETVPQYGIEIVDVQIKQINYIESVRQKVYERMISERNRIAEKFRSEGQGERAKIDGVRARDLKKNRIGSL